MLKDAIRSVWDDMPKFNPVIAEGVAYHQCRNIEQVIDRLMKINFRHSVDPRLPKDFNYIDCEILTPEAEYKVRSREMLKQHTPSRRSKNKGFSMQQTDTYMVRYNFQNGNEIFSRQLALPFVRRGGIIHLEGVKYGVAPVLKTKGISLTPNGYFIEFQSSKVRIEWQTFTYNVNGTHEHVYMPYSTSLHQAARSTSKKYVPTLACWLFAKYGFNGTFEKFLNTKVDIYNVDDPKLQELDTEEYAVCRSPLTIRGAAPQVAVVIRKEEFTPVAKILIGTLFYVACNYPTRVLPEYVADDTLWQIMLGFAIFGSGQWSEARIVSEILDHFENLEQMLDPVFDKELAMEGIECETTYDFLYYIIETLTNRSGDEISSMANLWGRYFTSIEYLTFDIRYGIYKARWELINSAADSSDGRKVGNPVNKRRVIQTMSRWLNTDIIEWIKTKHGEISPFMTTTDNMLLGLTSHCIDQTDARPTGNGKNKTIDLKDPSKHLHPSLAEVGSMANLPKSSPIGWARINATVQLDSSGRIIPKEKFKKILKNLAADIRQKGVA